MYGKPLCFAILACFTTIYTYADEVVTLFMRPYPTATVQPQGQQLPVSPTAHTPLLKSLHSYELVSSRVYNPVAGIFATYAGFLSISNEQGQIIFPRLQEPALIHLLITNKIVPIMITGHTVSHWELEKNIPADMYQFERYFDPETQLYYWQAEHKDLPQDQKIPLDTLIVFAKPSSLYIPLGVTVTHSDPNLVLPDIYVKRGVKAPLNALYLLNLRHFFGPIGFIHQHKELYNQSRMYDWP